MAKGNSKLGGSGGSIATTATAENGAVIDLTNTPLQYGAKDPAVAGNMRKNVEAQENKRLSAKIEYGAVYDSDGNIIGSEVKGSRGSVRVPYSNYVQATVMTHNHPRGADAPVLGGTFSSADMKTFAYFDNVKTMRASASEGTYSITKGAGFDDKKFISYVNQVHRTREKEYSAREGAKRKDYRAGKITYSEYSQSVDESFNTFLIALHNDFLAGQKQYGYNYTLEKR